MTLKRSARIAVVFLAAVVALFLLVTLFETSWAWF
jgi:hypothetical protein